MEIHRNAVDFTTTITITDRDLNAADPRGALRLAMNILEMVTKHGDRKVYEGYHVQKGYELTACHPFDVSEVKSDRGFKDEDPDKVFMLDWN